MVWFSTDTTRSSWQMASKLPSSLIEEYENSIRGEIGEMLTSGGQTVHTVLTAPNSRKTLSQLSEIALPLKKAKVDDQSKFHEK